MKIIAKIAFLACSTASLYGCAGIDFGDDGLAYFDPKPYFFVTTGADCQTTGTVVAIPDEKRHLKFKNGYGSAKLSASLSNGILTSVGQETDTKIPETITSVAGVVTAANALVAEGKGAKKACEPTAIMYPIENGKPNPESPVSFPVIISSGK